MINIALNGAPSTPCASQKPVKEGGHHSPAGGVPEILSLKRRRRRRRRKKMPRMTKAMLEEDNGILRSENKRLRSENWHLKEVNELLKTRQFDVDAFCRMHAEAVTAIAHVVTDLRAIAQKLY